LPFLVSHEPPPVACKNGVGGDIHHAGGQTMASNAHVIAVDDSNFDDEVLLSELPVLVDFVGTWCGPCKALAPVVESFAIEHAGSVKVVTVNTDDSPRIAARFGIMAVPTLMVFRDGQKTAGHRGVATKKRMKEMIEG
jgi:thioredoxin 1